MPSPERSSSARPCSRTAASVASKMANTQHTIFAFMSSLKVSRQLLCRVRFVFVSTFNLQQGICRWNHQFEQKGCLCKGKSAGLPHVSEENVRRVQESFERSPRKSTRRVSRELGIPLPTVWRVLTRRLLFN